MNELNYNEFKKDIENIRSELETVSSDLCMNHFYKIKFICDFFYFIGIISLCLSPYYIFSWLFLALGIFGKWTMIGHHVCHGGYDTISKGQYHRRKFGIKSFYRRFVDWFDWWYVEAWNIEHNNLHHYNLGEVSDPDLVENNFEWRNLQIPIIIKKIMIFFIACVWKWFYYAPNTYKYYCLNRLKNNNINMYNKVISKQKDEIFTIRAYLLYYEEYMNGFFSSVLFPYFAYMFICIPLFHFVLIYNINNLIYLYNMNNNSNMNNSNMNNSNNICNDYYYDIYNIMCNVYFNLIYAEIFTNLHSFLVIATNHCGEDLYRFSTHVEPRSSEFYLRQIISSANFTTGNDFIDFLHGWLNYQIEHHLFPDLSMYQYRLALPRVKKICKKHKIPYVQENVFIRLCKTVDIMTGKTSMRKFN